MQLRRLLCGLIVLTLVTPEQVLAALASSSSHVQAQDDRAERERKNNADKAAKKAAEQTKDYADNLKEIQPELDEFAASLLDARYADPFLQDYVNELGQSLVPKEVRPGTLFAFRVLDNPEPNAFALPDGRIYINTGLLLFAQNEAQLAVVLGHEIAHVTEQHYVESVKAQRREQVVSGVLGAVSGAIVGALTLGKKGVVDGAVLGAAAGIVVATVRMNNYNRRQEDEADSVGTMLALDRKYDAREGVAFFKKLMDTYGDQGRFANALYGKHSRNKDRMSYIDQLVTGNLGPKYNELRSSGSLTTGTGQMQMYTSRMIRDVSIYLMDYHDQYAVAKEHLLDVGAVARHAAQSLREVVLPAGACADSPRGAGEQRLAAAVEREQPRFGVQRLRNWRAGQWLQLDKIVHDDRISPLGFVNLAVHRDLRQELRRPRQPQQQAQKDARIGPKMGCIACFRHSSPSAGSDRFDWMVHRASMRSEGFEQHRQR